MARASGDQDTGAQPDKCEINKIYLVKEVTSEWISIRYPLGKTKEVTDGILLDDQ